MTLLDSNIIIAASKAGEEPLQDWLEQHPLAVSAITMVEVLGYHGLAEADRLFFEGFFKDTVILPITQRIIQRAIGLRQIRKMSLGDSIIAACALIHHVPLLTRNTKDFAHIAELHLINSMSDED